VRHSPNGSRAPHQQQLTIGSRHSITRLGVVRPSGARHHEADVRAIDLEGGGRDA
jgi:hypothetical protein